MAFAVRATSTLRGWNANPIRQRAAQVLQLYRPVLAEQLKEEIQKAQFEWPRPTRRYGALLGPSRGRKKVSLEERARIIANQGGRYYTTAGSPRNIVDSGAFLASQADYQPDPLILRYSWGGNGGPVTYAGIILRGKTNYPPRDWIKPALDEQPLRRFFIANWGRTQRSLPLTPRR